MSNHSQTPCLSPNSTYNQQHFFTGNPTGKGTTRETVEGDEKNRKGRKCPLALNSAHKQQPDQQLKEDTQDLLPQCSQTHHNPDKYLTMMSDNQNASAIMNRPSVTRTKTTRNTAGQ